MRGTLILAILMTACAATVRADDAPFGPQRGVLLLRNGEMIEGEVTLAGDRYDVVVPSGEIHVRRSEVLYLCRTVLECYERRKTLVMADKVQDHLELADWCLRNHLHEQAALALADAVATDPTHPRISLLERRLKFEIGNQKPAAAHAKPAAEESPSSRDLDRMIASLPPGAVESFTNTIQPMLLNHCSTAGCHGPQGTASLQLMRVPTNKAPSRRATQRNLYAILSAIDQAHPGASPLLSAPTRAHGQAKSAVFTTREALQYRQLVEWVYTVSNQHPPLAESSTLADPHVSRAAARRHAAHVAGRSTNKPTEPGTVRTGFSHLANPAPASEEPEDAESTKADAAKPAAERKQSANESDAFDPQAFNDRYLKAPGE